MKILLTGATGYIGQNLMKRLKDRHHIVAISRSTEGKEDEPNVTWKSADLFDPQQVSDVMEGVELAIYLVHSMQPQAKLTQASFEDMDALLADNFARAAAKHKVGRIVYLSGIIPQDGKKLSRHLRSRLECEKILGSYHVPVTTLRAGLIVGPEGSSFPILQSLVERLPGLVVPKWAYNRTDPVALQDVMDAFEKIIESDEFGQQAIDIGGPQEMNYKDLFAQTAEVMGKKLPMVDLPIIPVWLSKAWVTLISNKPKEMVTPLLESLVHSMVVTDEHYVEGISNAPTSFKDSVKAALKDQKPQKFTLSHLPLPFIGGRSGSDRNDVKSIQRVTVPQGWTARRTADYYLTWLERSSFGLINTDITDHDAQVRLPFTSKPLLVLKKPAAAAYEDFATYLIAGGRLALARDDSRARLSFRQVLDTNQVIIAIHEFEPALPWRVYSLTQARLHLLVMTAFGYEVKALAAVERWRQDGIIPEAFNNCLERLMGAPAPQGTN
ncbi:NAD(P)H-binding protein [Rothia endophytica]|uniref:NAD(P)H-binding protein n=1 Tax=Rothia endophytica TaxID=1324766 RepID=UPI001F185383|nr:NAD(P)H-binding protein [Rothia endophytica]